MERHVYKNLVRDSGMSQSSIQRLFKRFLNEAPTVPIRSKNKVHLLLDGSYFPNDLCLILYYDHDLRYVQLYRHTDQERYKQIKEDLDNLKKLGVDVYSVTCDGHKAILKAIRKAYPQAIIQRCTVHIKRQAKNYLSATPQLIAGQELLRISNRVTSLKTYDECAIWLLSMKQWENKYLDFVNETSLNPETGRCWYKHKNLHAAYQLITKAIPNMFWYLDDPEIPNTTNRLESYFKHLKEKLTLHSGLRIESKRNFIKWYLHLKNTQ
jgi:AraC-like DNA-binding protein